MDLKYTSLHEQDLHLHWYQLDHLRIAGYGGADVWTAGIPERYIVKYRAGIGVDDKHNEMYRFFKAVKPDIIVTHQPPYGIHDGVSLDRPLRLADAAHLLRQQSRHALAFRPHPCGLGLSGRQKTPSFSTLPTSAR